MLDRWIFRSVVLDRWIHLTSSYNKSDRAVEIEIQVKFSTFSNSRSFFYILYITDKCFLLCLMLDSVFTSQPSIKHPKPSSQDWVSEPPQQATLLDSVIPNPVHPSWFRKPGGLDGSLHKDLVPSSRWVFFSWNLGEFTETMRLRFLDEVFDNIVGEFNKLLQLSLVDEYQASFEELHSFF